MKTTKYNLMIAVLLSFSFTACYEDGGDLLDNINGGSTPATTTGMVQLYQVIDENIIPSEEGKADESWMQDPLKHKEMWTFYKAFSTTQELSWINEFEVYDGGGQEYGYVVNLSEDLTKWRLGLAIDGAYVDGLNGNNELAHTVIHEQFHVMSLNSTQLNPETESCFYNTQEGCSRDGSYLDDFVEAFWTDILEEHKKINPSNGNKLYRFYEKYQDRFVNDYAATNPEEDIAESFTYFVKKGQGTSSDLMRDKKIAHFYQYPELVELRDRIRASGFDLGDALIGKKSGSHRKCKHNKVL